MRDGVLIVFEGIDGAGKTTQLELAAKRLKADGWPVLTARNLGGTPIGEELRKVMLSNLERPAETDLYISAAIQSALIPAVKQARHAGKIILLDRGPLSLAAYQIYGSGVSAGLARPHVEAGLNQLKPDLTIFYDGDVETMLARAKQKSSAGDYFENKPPDYFSKVTDGYRRIIRQYKYPVITINADQILERVTVATTEAIDQTLSDKGTL